MLDYSTLIVEQSEKGWDPRIALVCFVIVGILVIAGIAVSIFVSPAGLLLVVAAIPCVLAGDIAQRSTLKNVVVKIQPTVENLDQMANGESIVKRGDDYYFIDTLSSQKVKDLQKTNKLNETVLKDFKGTAETFK